MWQQMKCFSWGPTCPNGLYNCNKSLMESRPLRLIDAGLCLMFTFCWFLFHCGSNIHSGWTQSYSHGIPCTKKLYVWYDVLSWLLYMWGSLHNKCQDTDFDVIERLKHELNSIYNGLLPLCYKLVHGLKKNNEVNNDLQILQRARWDLALAQTQLKISIAARSGQRMRYTASTQ